MGINLHPPVVEQRRALAPTLRAHDRAIRRLIAGEPIEVNRRQFRRTLRALRRVRAGGDMALYQSWRDFGGGFYALQLATYREAA